MAPGLRLAKSRASGTVGQRERLIRRQSNHRDDQHHVFAGPGRDRQSRAGRAGWTHPDVRPAAELTEHVAIALASRGVRPGDRVAMVFPNGPEAILLFLATSVIGVCCPLNPGYKEDEFRFYLEDTGARFLLVPPGEAGAARQALPAGGKVIEAELDAAGRLQLSNHGTPKQAHSIDGADPEATALVLHTSGTTSRPKRVPLRHRNLITSARNIIESYELIGDDVSLCIMPLFHVHGLVASALAALGSGGTVVVPRRFNPLGFRPLLEADAADVVQCLADAASADPVPSAKQAAARIRAPAVRSLVQLCPFSGTDAGHGGALWCPGARGLRHDRGKSPDGVESAAPGASRAGQRRARHRGRDSDPQRGRETSFPPGPAARWLSEDQT